MAGRPSGDDRRADPRPPAAPAAVGIRATRRAGPVCDRLVARRGIGGFTERGAASDCLTSAGRVSHLRIDPEIEADGPHDPDGALRTILRRHGWRSAAAHPARDHADHRPARRRGRALGRPPQEVAPVREPGAVAGLPGRRGRRRPAARVLRDLPGDGGPGRLPDPHRAGVSRCLGGVSGPTGQARLLFAEDAEGRPRPRCSWCSCGPARRGAIRRHDGAGRRGPRQLPREVGGDPHVARAGRDVVRPVGPRDARASPTSRRGSAAARSATSERGTSCSTRLGARRSTWRSAAACSSRVVGTGCRVAGGPRLRAPDGGAE